MAEEEEMRAHGTGKRIKEIRGEMTQIDFAQLMGVSRSTLLRYEKDDDDKDFRLPDAEFILKLNVLYNVDVAWFLTGNNLFANKVPNGSSEAGEISVRDNKYLVPRYDVKAHAGAGVELMDESHIVDVIAFQADWLERRLGLSAGECFLIEITGNSMLPTLQDGDLALIDARVNVVSDSGVYAFIQEGRVRVKRIQKKLSGSLKVISDNTAYETEEITANEAKDFRVIGRVVWPRLR